MTLASKLLPKKGEKHREKREGRKKQAKDYTQRSIE
jgi:hypothetical protein